MPSFDVVSEVDQHELTNAVDQVNREIGNRFDFKGADAKISQQEDGLTVEAASSYQVQQIQPMLYQRLAKRGLDVQCLDAGDIESRGQRAYQKISVKQGIDKETAKKLTKLVKESKLKVQAAVQGEQLRITGKKRDDLQDAIAVLKQSDLGVPLQFNNFRD